MSAPQLEVTQNVISLLPLLEPICGAGLAVNLAYLALERFRHRDKIREQAKVELARVAGKPFEQFHGSAFYRRVQKLASLPNNEETRTRDSAPVADAETPVSKKFMQSAWIKVYEIIFDRHSDRLVAKIFVAVCSFFLVLGVGHSLNYFSFSHYYWRQDSYYLLTSYILVSCAFVFPLLFILLGQFMVKWSADHSTACIDELMNMMKMRTRQAQVRRPVRTPFGAPPPIRIPVPPRSGNFDDED